MNKKEVIKVLELIAIYMEIKGENSFKVSAYRKAAQALESDERTLAEIEDPSKLKGIGKGTSEVILELKENGTSSLLEELQAELPSGLIPLLKLPGLGGKKIGKLYQELNVTDLESLREACESKKVQVLAGFGKKTEEKILVAIEEVEKRPERFPIAYVLPIAVEIEKQLEQFDHIERYSRAGSLRRLRETVKDLDFIISTNDPEKVKEQLLSLPRIVNVIAAGNTKVSVELGYDYPVGVDFRLVKPHEFATTLHHFTGSKDHNVKMRQLAKERGEKISEYGVENVETGEVKTFETEEQFFKHFNLCFIPPEAREDQGEVETSRETLDLIDLKDIQSDLHMHTTWSDGAYSIKEMAEAARAKGYSYIAITDHSQYLKVANGLTEERLIEQMKEIKRVNEEYDDFKIFTGIEMDILPNSTLDFSDELLEQVDFVIGSIHSSFSQDRETIMKRLTTALRNNHVDLIAHPTGRLIGRRSGYDVDIEMLIQLAKETDTALELNANPHRLDLSAEWLKKAQDAGVKLSINTDAHHSDHFDFMEIGVGVARKGMIKKETVINTFTREEFERFINRHH
ncbi:DNA polymerase/3'-5' exonuclease PolX [Alkalihalobacterium chitinilyticum]|uniref:DNA-directed DNA polymerase n=1 Tax=Alkalihalobacterium chitinilyticum TaxID=2980103 RepID=A0ABT5VA69_9BACI|nr:DNA polymerase/3'-5' exonuclease PolX [Alkalihalobacterium chitinilyticum]MDE5412369.1 DNA polymerase/3'-5' exonuclease PolX [Alkalihalobacterium chitinilyticum]